MTAERIRTFLRWVFRRNAVETELDDELREYLELYAADKVREGVSPKEAHRLARLELGGIEQTKERVRTGRTGAALEMAALESKHAWRRVLGDRSLVAAATLCVGLAVGANTAVFSALDAAVLKPLRFPHAERLVSVPGAAFSSVAVPDTLEWYSQGPFFELLANYRSGEITLSRPDGAERVSASKVSAQFPLLFEVEPVLGRLFDPDEEIPGSDRVALLGHGAWQRLFGADPEIVGTELNLSGTFATVVGVLPPGFNFPARSEMWVLRQLQGGFPLGGNAATSRLGTIGRLRPGISATAATGQLQLLLSRLEEMQAGEDLNVFGAFIEARPLAETLGRSVRTPLLVLYGAVALVLAIACANLANLLLIRGIQREREIGIRSSLGGSRFRLMGQFLAEAAVLDVLGIAFAVGLAYAGVPIIRALGTPLLPGLADLAVDTRVLTYAAVVSTLTVTIATVLPALHTWRLAPIRSLKESGIVSGPGRARRFALNSLAVSEIALALALLIGAILMVRSFATLSAVDPGLDPRGVLTITASTPEWKSPARQSAARDNILERFRTLPGVASVAATSYLPLSSDRLGAYYFSLQPAESSETQEGVVPTSYITPGYFRSLGIPMLAGSDFRVGTADPETPRVIVSEVVAEWFGGPSSALGRRMIVRDSEHEIIGVVSTVTDTGLDRSNEPRAYLPFTAEQAGAPFYILRSDDAAEIPIEPIRSIIRDIDPDIVITSVDTMTGVVAASLGEPRGRGILLSVFAAIALLVAATGTFGVISFSVTRRRREMGIRMALGARSVDMVKMVLAHCIRLSLAGVMLGGLIAWWLSRFLTTLLFGVEAGDPTTFLLAVGALALAILGACAWPARRAAQIDPLTELRHE